jgi:hypothetical protein
MKQHTTRWHTEQHLQGRLACRCVCFSGSSMCWRVLQPTFKFVSRWPMSSTVTTLPKSGPEGIHPESANLLPACYVLFIGLCYLCHLAVPHRCQRTLMRW